MNVVIDKKFLEELQDAISIYYEEDHHLRARLKTVLLQKEYNDADVYEALADSLLDTYAAKQKLKELQDKKLQLPRFKYDGSDWYFGWNACIDEIVKLNGEQKWNQQRH